jgi:hypothetical protein
VLLIAKWASNDKGLEGEILRPCRHVPTASFALHDESLSFLYSEVHHVSFQVYSVKFYVREQF